MQLEKHPKKTFIGGIEKGFDFLGYRFTPHSLTLVRRLGAVSSSCSPGVAASGDDVMVGVVSYLEEPLFGFLQFDEVIDAVRGLQRGAGIFDPPVVR